MSFIVSSFIPFPNTTWWALVHRADTVLFDKAEHFQKMSYRNRYCIAGANGVITLSIPLIHGRNQRTAMQDVKICYKEHWQTQHWRTLEAAYNRSPYFEFYAHSLQALYQHTYIHLIDFNFASIHWLKQQLNMQFEEKIINIYEKKYDGALHDVRSGFNPNSEKNTIHTSPQYYQTFQERNGFIPHLSLLDLLFAEGPNAGGLLICNF